MAVRHNIENIGELKSFQTSEGAFQLAKVPLDAQDYESIRRNCEGSGSMAAKIGRNRNVFAIRPDWDGVKDGIMRAVLYYKFAQDTPSLETLLGTRQLRLVEKTTSDHYWGCGTKKNGHNKLGEILMEVREYFYHLIRMNESHISHMFNR